jgi:PST family polysaccharide transporter
MLAPFTAASSPVIDGLLLAFTLALLLAGMAREARRRTRLSHAAPAGHVEVQNVLPAAADPQAASVSRDEAGSSPKPPHEASSSDELTKQALTSPATDGERNEKPRKGATGRMRSSSILLGANLLEALLPLVRNIALTRLISPEEFGLAISLAVVLGLIEVLTDFGLPIFAVRKNTPVPAGETMMTLQSLALIRSAILGGILVLASPLIAWAFHAPDATLFYAMLGLIAFLRGFENLSVKEQMRHSIYWQEAVVIAVSNTVLTVVTLVAASILGSFECMIWGMLSGTIAIVVLSNLLAPRRYRLGWNSIAARDAAGFGRPLLINGAAVAIGTSDRFLVAGVFGPAALALFNVAIGTAMLPRTILARFLTSFFVPLFVKVQRDRDRELQLSDTWAWCLSALAFTYGIGLTFVGDRVLGLVFGASYQPSRVFMAIAGLSVCIKFLMMLPVPGAYAVGHTRRISEGAILSALAILPGAAAALLSGNLSVFLFAMTVSELFALLWFTARTCRERPFSRALVWPLITGPVALLGGLVAIAVVWPDLTFGIWTLISLASLLLGALFYGLVMRRGTVALSALL